jgi:hypothetical protein
MVDTLQHCKEKALHGKSIARKKEKERNLDCSDENRSAIRTRALWRWHGK